MLVCYVKQSGMVIFLVGYVIKEGVLVGLWVFEYMVDIVLYFEGELDGCLCLLWVVKNCFGVVNELGVFGMIDKGLKEVSNFLVIFFMWVQEVVFGSVVMVIWEGLWLMLVEVQVLVDISYLVNLWWVILGFDQNCLVMLLVVLYWYGGILIYDQDVFFNVVGGVKVLEIVFDLVLMVVVMFSLCNCLLLYDLLVFGEVGLFGEVCLVLSGQECLKEVGKYGFKCVIVFFGNVLKEVLVGLQVIVVMCFEQVLDVFFE